MLEHAVHSFAMLLVASCEACTATMCEMRVVSAVMESDLDLTEGLASRKIHELTHGQPKRWARKVRRAVCGPGLASPCSMLRSIQSFPSGQDSTPRSSLRCNY
jgi:hypothetical protein